MVRTASLTTQAGTGGVSLHTALDEASIHVLGAGNVVELELPVGPGGLQVVGGRRLRLPAGKKSPAEERFPRGTSHDFGAMRRATSVTAPS